MATPMPTKLYQGVPSTSETTLFTAPCRCVIRSIRLSGDATGGTISLSVVPSGGSAGVANRIAQAFAVAAAASLNLLDAPEEITMNQGDFISGLQSSGTHITATISGATYGEA